MGMAKVVGACVAICVCGTSAQVMCGVTQASIGIQAYDLTHQTYAAPIPTAPNIVYGLAADDANRIMYLSSGGSLFTVSYDAPQSPVLVAAFTGDTESMTGGLGFDTRRRKLYGTGTYPGTTTLRAFFEIDVATAVTRLVRLMPAGEFTGLDYDPVGDVVYAANDVNSVNGEIVGRGLYRIALPLETGAFTRIALYPMRTATQAELDIDGVAVGNGRVYMCTDETQWMYVYNLATGQYETPVAQTAFGPDRFSCGATYAASYFIAGQYDLSVSASGPADCSIRVGTATAFGVRVRSIGTRAMTNVSARITLPVGATLVGSTPSGTLNAGVLTVPLGQLNAGATSDIMVTLIPNVAGTNTLSVQVSGAETDGDLSNNTASASTRTYPALPGTAVATGVLSTVAASSSSLVPGVAGARFRDAGVESFGRPYTSTSGQRLILSALTDVADPLTDQVVVMVDPDGASVVGRERVSPAVDGPGGNLPPLTIDPVLGVNDSGMWAFAGTDARGGFVALVTGASAIPAARQGDAVPGVPGGVQFGPAFSSPSISANGNIAFLADLTGTTPETNAAAFALSGLQIVARKGLTVPFSQTDFIGSPTFFSIKSFDAGDGAVGFSMDENHEHFVMSGAINGSTTSPPPGGVDRVLMRDDTDRGGPRVRVQENRPISTLAPTDVAADTSPFSFGYMAPQGNWFAVVTTQAGVDLAMVNNVVVSRSGDEIVPGAGERWARTGASPWALGLCGDAAGNYVLVGSTNAADALRNSAAVLNSAAVIARENDPVDLDGDGVFDDGAYIAEFLPHHCVLGADAFFAVVRLRGEAGASGCGQDATLGYALIRVPVAPTAPQCPADFNQDGGIDGADVESFFASWESAEALADVNQDGGVDGADVEVFFAAWAAGGC